MTEPIIDEVWLDDDAPAPTPEPEHGHFQAVYDTLPTQRRRKNRAQRRADARYYLGRNMRRNLHGWGRWRRGTTVTTGRYDFPFAQRLDG